MVSGLFFLFCHTGDAQDLLLAWRPEVTGSGDQSCRVPGNEPKSAAGGQDQCPLTVSDLKAGLLMYQIDIPLFAGEGPSRVPGPCSVH